MQLVGDKILVKPLIEETTTSGIFIPVKSQNKNVGKVLMIGSRVQKVRVGDSVKYENEAGVKFDFDGSECLILREGNKRRRGDVEFIY